MKTISIALASSLIASLSLFAQERPQPHLSIKHEIKRAIERGNDYLKKQQHADGYWGQEKYPALSALALTAAAAHLLLKNLNLLPRGITGYSNSKNPTAESMWKG